CSYFFFQAEDGIRDRNVTGVQTCALPIYHGIGFENSTKRTKFAGACLLLAKGREHAKEATFGNVDVRNAVQNDTLAKARRGEWRSEERRVGTECRTPSKRPG